MERNENFSSQGSTTKNARSAGIGRLQQLGPGALVEAHLAAARELRAGCMRVWFQSAIIGVWTLLRKAQGKGDGRRAASRVMSR